MNVISGGTSGFSSVGRDRQLIIMAAKAKGSGRGSDDP